MENGVQVAKRDVEKKTTIMVTGTLASSFLAFRSVGNSKFFALSSMHTKIAFYVYEQLMDSVAARVW